jgi:hypothetical protein
MEFEINILNYGSYKVTYGTTIKSFLASIGKFNSFLTNIYGIILDEIMPLRGPAEFNLIDNDLD